MTISKAYEEDLAALEYVARHATTTLANRLLIELYEFKSQCGNGSTQLPEWLADRYLLDVLGDNGGDFVLELEKLQMIISDKHWVDKEVARVFANDHGPFYVRLKFLDGLPRFERASLFQEI